MSRRRAQQTQGVQLFPFLDVLLSAMGALILLLALASRNLSKQEADLAANSPAADELQLRHEMVEWEIEQLTKQRDKTAADLAEERSQFGHLEQHARQLRSELEEILRAEEKLAAQADSSNREQKEQELRELRSRIAASKSELESVLADQEAAGSSYAIVPYQGPNETRRRPIYIECRAQEIVIQPEGVVLTAQDFDGPLGPGNPLAAAVRAAREHLSRQRSSSEGDSGEPYPLMLVRPDGIETFYAARAALDSWGSEFGYEFIEADWKIKYQPANADLATVEQDAVDTAREQMRLVAQFAPRINRNVTARTYRASKSGGGIEAEDGGGPSGGRRGYGHERGPGHSGGFASDRGTRGGGGDGWADNGERNGGGYPSSGSRGRYGSDFDSPGGGFSDGGMGDYSTASAVGSSRATAPYQSALQDVQARRSQEASAAAVAGGGAGGPLAGATGTGSGVGSGGRYGGGNPGGSGYGSSAGSLGGNGSGNSQAEQIPPGTTDRQLAGSGTMTGEMTGNAASAGNAGGSAAGGTAGQAGSNSPDEGPAFPGSNNGSSGTAQNGGTQNGGSAGGQQPPGIVGIGGGGMASPPPPGGMNSGASLPPIGAQFGEQNSQSQPNASSPAQQQASRNSGPTSPFDSHGTPKGNYSSSKSGKRGGPSYAKRSNHKGENNWALPEAAPSSVPLSRPIRVQCREDRVTVFAERGGTATSRVIEFGPDTGDSVDEFVAAIRDHMETWGIAGEGFYWHPIVKLETVGNGSARATELKSLLTNSGLEFRDPPPADSVRRAMSHTMR